MYLKTTIFLLLLPAASLGKDFFRAAVFEHRPRFGESEDPFANELANLQFFEKAGPIAADKGADILVFNEYGLRPYVKSYKEHRTRHGSVPDPSKVKFNPCLNPSDDNIFLTRFSCLARNNNIYVVANMIDAHPCSGTCDAFAVDCSGKCPEDDYFMYNTNMAFDREGNLIARYHKQHTYFENFEIPEEPEFTTFETEFGVFGLIICFDSVWAEASIQSREHGIDTMVFPTFWFDDNVPLNAVEWQQSFAFANNVNFLAANTQTPGNGSLGSGIYSKDLGALAYTYEPDGESKLVMANVPLKTADLSTFQANPSITVVKKDMIYEKHETGEAFPLHEYVEMAGEPKVIHLDYRYFKDQMENHTLVKLEKPSGEVKACNNDFCCSLSYSAGDMKEDFYLGAKSGSNNVAGYYYWCEESCILLRCDPLGGRACVSAPSRSETVFSAVKIEAVFTTDVIYPTVSKSKHRLAPKSEWTFEKKGKKASLEFVSENEEPMLKVAMLGRCYDRDPPYKPFKY